MPPPGRGFLYPSFAGLAALFVGIGLGRFAYGPLIPALVLHGWFTGPQAGYLAAMNLAGYLAGAAASRSLAARLPSAPILRAAMLCTALSFLACSWPLGFALYSVARFAAGLCGGLLMVLAPPLVLGSIPPGRRALAGAVIFTGVGAGIAMAGTVVPLLARTGPREAWLALAAIAALLAAFAWAGFPSGAGGAQAAASGARLTRPVRLLLLAYGLSAIGFLPHTVFWVDYLARGLGLGLEAGGRHWALLGVAAATGPLITGLPASRLGAGRTFALTLVVNVLGVALPLFSSRPVALLASSIIVGAGAMALPALASGTVGELVDPDHRRQVWGWATICFAICYAAAGYGMAFVAAATGSLRAPFAIGAVALCGAAASAALAARPNTGQSRSPR